MARSQGVTATGYEKVDTKKLKFILSVGEAGLLVWKGSKPAEVRYYLELVHEELRRRAEKGEVSC